MANTKTKPSDAFLALESFLTDACQAEDRSWLDCPPDYIHCLEAEEVVRSFRENYTSRKMGFSPFDHLSGDEIADALLKTVDEEKLSSLLLTHAEAEPCDYYTQWNEVGSVSIGETEHQIDVETDTELSALVDACTEAELKALHYRCGYGHQNYGHFNVYGSPCDRLIWKLDPETFLEAATPLLRAAGLVDPDEATEGEADA